MHKVNSSKLYDESEKVKRIKIGFKIKATFWDSMSFSPKPKAPDLIPYHDEVESDPLQISEQNDSIGENEIALYDNPIIDHG